MEYIVVCTVALLVSGLTLVSGFGLGTLLMPAFALFFPLPMAVAATAVVHLANNIFKLFLLGKKADLKVVALFALPGALCAMAGAYALTFFENADPLFTYTYGGTSKSITAIGLVIGCTIIFFSLFDLLPRFQKLSFDRKFLPLGGAISGLFGGLSGHQGALRSAFLIKSGLEKETFIATGVVCAVVVDVARLFVYGLAFYSHKFGMLQGNLKGLIVAACLSAFVGAFFGKKLLKKMTLTVVQMIVGLMLVVLGMVMAIGLI